MGRSRRGEHQACPIRERTDHERAHHGGSLQGHEWVPQRQPPEGNFNHYRARGQEGNENLFNSNQTNKPREIAPEFRVTGRQPELWNAVDGSIRALAAYEQKEASTIVPIKLAPYESTFVVFRKPATDSSSADISDNYPQLVTVEELQGPWKVRFEPERRGPEEPVTFQQLHDWTTSSDDRIKYYS